MEGKVYKYIAYLSDIILLIMVTVCKLKIKMQKSKLQIKIKMFREYFHFALSF